MRAFFENLVGPGLATPALWAFAAIVLAVLLFIFVRVAQRLTAGTFVAGGRNRKQRLAVMDAAAVDTRRRLVLVRRDDVEHLILIGGPTDVVVEQNIQLMPRTRTVQPANETAPAAIAEPAGTGRAEPERSQPPREVTPLRAAQPAMPRAPEATMAPLRPLPPQPARREVLPPRIPLSPPGVRPSAATSADQSENRVAPSVAQHRSQPATTARPVPEGAAEQGTRRDPAQPGDQPPLQAGNVPSGQSIKDEMSKLLGSLGRSNR